MPALFTRRQVWLPSLWGSIMMIVIGTGSAFWLFTNLAYFLAEKAPVPSRYLVVEGWLDKSGLEQALTIFNQDGYELLITTGGPDPGNFNMQYATYAEQAGAELKKMGLQPSNLMMVPAPASAQERTYLSAVMVRVKLAEAKLLPDSINVFSADVHARRTHLLYQLAFRETTTRVGVLAAYPDRYKLARWWQTSEGAKSVLTELIGWLWVKCCFEPGEVDSHRERWGQYDTAVDHN